MFLVKCFSVALVFMAFGMMNCDNEEGFIDSDTEDPGGLPEPESYDFQYLFECPSDVTVPADVVQYKNYHFGNEVVEFSDAVWNLAGKWFDKSCLEECEVIPPVTECLEADCITDAGATMIASFILIEEDVDYPSQTTALESLTIIPPQGAETWQKITMEGELFVEYGGCDERELDTRSIEWEGEIFADLPSDYAVESTFSSDMKCGPTNRILEWKHEHCDLVVDYFSEVNFESGGEYADYDITVNNNNVLVTSSDSENYDVWKGTVNGEYAGIVNQKTWNIIGE